MIQKDNPFVYPFPEILKELKNQVKKDLKEAEDGFDLCYPDGMNFIIDILENQWDGGLTEAYLKGIKDAIDTVNGQRVK